jgi:hypothetical protein
MGLADHYPIDCPRCPRLIDTHNRLAGTRVLGADVVVGVRRS